MEWRTTGSGTKIPSLEQHCRLITSVDKNRLSAKHSRSATTSLVEANNSVKLERE